MKLQRTHVNVLNIILYKGLIRGSYFSNNERNCFEFSISTSTLLWEFSSAGYKMQGRLRAAAIISLYSACINVLSRLPECTFLNHLLYPSH